MRVFPRCSFEGSDTRITTLQTVISVQNRDYPLKNQGPLFGCIPIPGTSRCPIPGGSLAENTDLAGDYWPGSGPETVKYPSNTRKMAYIWHELAEREASRDHILWGNGPELGFESVKHPSISVSIRQYPSIIDT